MNNKIKTDIAKLTTIFNSENTKQNLQTKVDLLNTIINAMNQMNIWKLAMIKKK